MRLKFNDLIPRPTLLQLEVIDISGVIGYETLLEVRMKVIAHLSPDRELTRLVGCRWICPRFQASFISHLISALL